MVKIPELTVDDVFTRLRSNIDEDILVLPERVDALYAFGGVTCLGMGRHIEESPCPTVQGTVQEVAAKLVATMNRRRQREAEATDALDKALMDDEIDKIVDEQERRPSRRRRSRSTE